MTVRASEQALSTPDIAARLDRLIAGQVHLSTLIERVVHLRTPQPAPAWFDADVVARLGRIEAELKSWTPVLAALNWQLLGISVQGDPPATITIGRNEPVDGTPVDSRTPDIRD